MGELGSPGEGKTSVFGKIRVWDALFAKNRAWDALFAKNSVRRAFFWTPRMGFWESLKKTR